MKKAFLLLLTLLCAVLALSGCSASLSDEEAQAILRELVPKSQLLNEVFWGDVMKTADPDVKPLASVSAGQYYEVSEDSPYHSIAAIKADAESVYTPEYAQTMYFMAFEGSDNIACRYKEENGVLLMNITYEPFDFGTEINIESAHVKRTTADTAIVEVECVKDGESRLRDLVLCSLDGVWLLDSPTY